MQIPILSEYERAIIIFALQFFKANPVQAEKQLGIDLAKTIQIPTGETLPEVCERLAQYAGQEPSGHTIEIDVEGGCVTDVRGLPDNWEYQLNDFDEPGDDDERPSYYSHEAHGTDPLTEHINQGGELDSAELADQQEQFRKFSPPSRDEPPPPGHGVTIAPHPAGHWHVVNEDGVVLDPTQRDEAEAIERAWELVDQAAEE